jgi:ABC-type nitrate/sulfonate/bicarbonate transport system permease component
MLYMFVQPVIVAWFELSALAFFYIVCLSASFVVHLNISGVRNTSWKSIDTEAHEELKWYSRPSS